MSCTLVSSAFAPVCADAFSAFCLRWSLTRLDGAGGLVAFSACEAEVSPPLLASEEGGSDADFLGELAALLDPASAVVLAWSSDDSRHGPLSSSRVVLRPVGVVFEEQVEHFDRRLVWAEEEVLEAKARLVASALGVYTVLGEGFASSE